MRGHDYGYSRFVGEPRWRGRDGGQEVFRGPDGIYPNINKISSNRPVPPKPSPLSPRENTNLVVLGEGRLLPRPAILR